MTVAWRGPVLVTGTDTGVGKTMVTAAIAAAAQAAGLRVAVVKPGQTGTALGEPSDVDVVRRLAAPATAVTLASYPGAAGAAGRRAGGGGWSRWSCTRSSTPSARRRETHDLVLVEGAGGLLVPMGLRPSGEPWTVADLAVSLGAPAVVVARAGLGTLNHIALTMEALARRAVPAGIVLGAWPAAPELVHWSNLTDLVPAPARRAPRGGGRARAGRVPALRPRLADARAVRRPATTGAPGPRRSTPDPAEAEMPCGKAQSRSGYVADSFGMTLLTAVSGNGRPILR